jgi:hypothetical protein
LKVNIDISKNDKELDKKIAELVINELTGLVVTDHNDSATIKHVSFNANRRYFRISAVRKNGRSFIVNAALDPC